MAVAVRHETELYAPVRAFFEARGYEVKSEVLHCDLVAVRRGEDSGEETVIVELKRTFNLELLLQGIERQRLCDRVVLAVERNRKKSGAASQRYGDLAELCRRLGLGLMTVTFFKTKAPLVEWIAEPGEPPLRGMRRKRGERLKAEFAARSGDYNIGGSTRRKLVTAYREQALRCAWALAAEGGEAPPRRVRELAGCPRAADILRDNHYGWFEHPAKGVYRLAEKGRKALREYAYVLKAWAPAAVGQAAAVDGDATLAMVHSEDARLAASVDEDAPLAVAGDENPRLAVAVEGDTPLAAASAASPDMPPDPSADA
jgi:hypothetical protein